MFLQIAKLNFLRISEHWWYLNFQTQIIKKIIKKINFQYDPNDWTIWQYGNAKMRVFSSSWWSKWSNFNICQCRRYCISCMGMYTGWYGNACQKVFCNRWRRRRSCCCWLWWLCNWSILAQWAVLRCFTYASSCIKSSFQICRLKSIIFHLSDKIVSETNGNVPGSYGNRVRRLLKQILIFDFQPPNCGVKKLLSEASGDGNRTKREADRSDYEVIIDCFRIIYFFNPPNMKTIKYLDRRSNIRTSCTWSSRSWAPCSFSILCSTTTSSSSSPYSYHNCIINSCLHSTSDSKTKSQKRARYNAVRQILLIFTLLYYFINYTSRLYGFSSHFSLKNSLELSRKSGTNFSFFFSVMSVPHIFLRNLIHQASMLFYINLRVFTLIKSEFYLTRITTQLKKNKNREKVAYIRI